MAINPLQYALAPHYELKVDWDKTLMDYADELIKLGLVSSKSDLRRLSAQGAITIFTF